LKTAAQIAATGLAMLMKTPDPEKGGEDHEREEEDERRLGFLLALIAVAVVVVLGLWLLWKMWENEKLQECIITGRRDCAPVAIPASP
jgi:hypothetical protein